VKATASCFFLLCYAAIQQTPAVQLFFSQTNRWITWQPVAAKRRHVLMPKDYTSITVTTAFIVLSYDVATRSNQCCAVYRYKRYISMCESMVRYIVALKNTAVYRQPFRRPAIVKFNCDCNSSLMMHLDIICQTFFLFCTLSACV